MYQGISGPKAPFFPLHLDRRRSFVVHALSIAEFQSKLLSGINSYLIGFLEN